VERYLCKEEDGLLAVFIHIIIFSEAGGSRISLNAAQGYCLTIFMKYILSLQADGFSVTE
jgi:hypothetical protein